MSVGPPAGSVGTVPEAVTGKLRLVAVDGSVTGLVGGVMSMSHEVDSEPEPGLPKGSLMPEALTFSVYVPPAAVSAAGH